MGFGGKNKNIYTAGLNQLNCKLYSVGGLMTPGSRAQGLHLLYVMPLIQVYFLSRTGTQRGTHAYNQRPGLMKIRLC
jgi:hypothetical protein